MTVTKKLARDVFQGIAMEAFTAVDFLEDVNIVAETVTALALMKRASNV